MMRVRSVWHPSLPANATAGLQELRRFAFRSGGLVGVGWNASPTERSDE